MPVSVKAMDGAKYSRKSLVGKLNKLESTKDAIDKIIKSLFSKVSFEIKNLLAEDEDVFQAQAEEKHREADFLLAKLKLVLEQLKREGESSSGVEEEDSTFSSPILSQRPLIFSPLPLQLGSETKSIITQFESVTNFWVEPRNFQTNTLTNLLEDYNLSCPDDSLLEARELAKNDFCMATKSCDGTLWLRAQVLDKTLQAVQGTPYANLYFIDIGAMEAQAISKIRPMPEYLKKFHPQAVHCSLRDAPPPDSSHLMVQQLNEQFKYFLGMPNVYVTFHSPLSSVQGSQQYLIDVIIKVSLANTVYEFPLSYSSLQKMMNLSPSGGDLQVSFNKVFNLIKESNSKISQLSERLKRSFQHSAPTKAIHDSSSTHSTSLDPDKSGTNLPQFSQKGSTASCGNGKACSDAIRDPNQDVNPTSPTWNGNSTSRKKPLFTLERPPGTPKAKKHQKSLDLIPPSYFSETKANSVGSPTTNCEQSDKDLASISNLNDFKPLFTNGPANKNLLSAAPLSKNYHNDVLSKPSYSSNLIPSLRGCGPLTHPVFLSTFRIHPLPESKASIPPFDPGANMNSSTLSPAVNPALPAHVESTLSQEMPSLNHHNAMIPSLPLEHIEMPSEVTFLSEERVINITAHKVPSSMVICPPSDEDSEELEEDWDPMARDFSSINNNYQVNFDDAEIAVTGYKAQDEKRICKFFEKGGRCFRGDSCHFEHIRKAPDDYTTRDKEEIYAIQVTPELPDEGTTLIAMISAYYTPAHFYLTFPYGREPIEVLKERCRNAQIYEDTFLPDLMEHMRKRYWFTKPSFMPSVRPAHGSEVACTDGNGNWYRCRIVEVDEGHVEAFLLDFGSQEIFPLSSIRNLHKDYVCIAPQALECFLSDVHLITPVSTRANNRFKYLIEGKLVLATFTERRNPHEARVTIELLEPPPFIVSRSLSVILVEEGLAELSENPLPSQLKVPMSTIVPE